MPCHLGLLRQYCQDCSPSVSLLWFLRQMSLRGLDAGVRRWGSGEEAGASNRLVSSLFVKRDPFQGHWIVVFKAPYTLQSNDPRSLNNSDRANKLVTFLMTQNPMIGGPDPHSPTPTPPTPPPFRKPATTRNLCHAKDNTIQSAQIFTYRQGRNLSCLQTFIFAV